jgi:hypothetical protein
VANPIVFGTDEAAIVAMQARFLEDVRNINWNTIYEDCVYVDVIRSDGLTTYRATAYAEAGGEEWSQSSSNSDRELARVHAVTKLFGHMLRMSLNMRRQAVRNG